MENILKQLDNKIPLIPRHGIEKHGRVSTVDLSRQTDEQTMEREERDKRIMEREEHDTDVSDNVEANHNVVERDGRQNVPEPSNVKGSKRVSYADIVNGRKVEIIK